MAIINGTKKRIKSAGNGYHHPRHSRQTKQKAQPFRTLNYNTTLLQPSWYIIREMAICKAWFFEIEIPRGRYYYGYGGVETGRFGPQRLFLSRRSSSLPKILRPHSIQFIPMSMHAPSRHWLNHLMVYAVFTIGSSRRARTNPCMTSTCAISFEPHDERA
jgi:hypothetical protein